MKKKTYHHGDLRSALIAAALQLTAETGARAVTLADAARRASVSVAAPYRHFENKEALLAAAAEAAFLDFGSALKAARLSTEEPVESMLRQGDAYIRFGETHPGCFELMFAMQFDFSQFAALAVASNAAFRELGLGVEALVRAKLVHVTDLEVTAQQLWFLAHGAAVLPRGSPLQADAKKVCRQAVEQLLAGKSRLARAQSLK